MYRNWNGVNPKNNMTKLQVNNKIYNYGLISKPNVNIICITISMWKQHNFENISTYYDFPNIQNVIINVFGYI